MKTQLTGPEKYREIFQHWLNSPSLSESEWQELSSVSGDDKEIESRFFAPLEFGTAGLRGIMGIGLNRMNIHVIRHATQAFASVIVSEGKQACKKGVVICYDCRHNSELFAREAACVMAANGVGVKIFDALRPTPELSFAIRLYEATAGLNITASHNPKEYNGYKVYWSDGAQLPPNHAKSIADAMDVIDIFNDIKRTDFDDAVKKGLIEFIGAETDEKFMTKVMSQAIDPGVVSAVADKFKVVFTPFHGTGHKLVPEALSRLGLKKLCPVAEQMIIDGAFPTVVSPNPENPEGFALAVETAEKIGADLIIGTDPDADRVGIMVRDGDKFVTVSGNQTGVLLLDYIITARKAKGSLPANAAAIKTIVTTEMARDIAEKNGVHIADTFTGFKFMAEKIARFESEKSHEYIMAFEESYGYMVGDYVRDKDAVTASMLIAEMAAYHFGNGMTLLEALNALYSKYGYYKELTLNLVMPGVDGLQKMRSLMADLRENPPKEIAGVSVLKQRDYQNGAVSVAGLGVVGETEIKGSDVLYFELADKTNFIVRPSGTEPKVKVYVLAHGENKTVCDEKADKYAEYAMSLKR
ncbi:MAG: phospho-sugar mutase [Oscillospiraceae bacterium]|nr:phospho-sugar mutase [Oscillospiraceae bacterium]